MMLVDVDRGRAEGIAMSKQLEALTKSEEEGEVDVPEHLERHIERGH
jgi:UMF1 family MFS transporter